METLFSGLLGGARVVLCPNEMVRSIADLHHFIEQEELTVLNLPFT